MRIKYEYEESRRGYCITPCPNGLKIGDIPNENNFKREHGNFVMVGSWLCARCAYFKADHDDMIVECNYLQPLSEELFKI